MSNSQIQTKPVLDLKTSAGFNFTLIANKLSRGLTKILRDSFDIGVVEWRVMAHLAKDEPCLASEIAKLGTIDKGLVSKTFKSLEAKGLINIECLSNEKRPRLASLTDQGHALHDEALPIVEARKALLFTDLSSAEIDQLFATLAKIRSNLDLL